MTRILTYNADGELVSERLGPDNANAVPFAQFVDTLVADIKRTVAKLDEIKNQIIALERST